MAAAVAETGVEDPALITRLLGGLLRAGMTAVEEGSPLEPVTAAVLGLVRGALPGPSLGS